MKNSKIKTTNRSSSKLKEKVINFYNRSFNSIKCAYMALKERYSVQVSFYITGKKNGLLVGYFIVK